MLDDVKLDAVAEKLFWGAFTNCGQVCSAIKRVYVPEKLYGPLVERLAALAKGVKVGDGFQEGVQLGPLNNRPQFERVKELVDDAKKAGARIVAGGAPVGGKGYFYQPTIVADVAEGVRLVDEEQFGPALPVLAYRNARRRRRAREPHALRAQRLGLVARVPSARPRSPASSSAGRRG